MQELAKKKGLGDKFVIPALLKKCDIPVMLSDKLYADFTNKAFDDACEELYRGIVNEPLGDQDRTFENGFVRQFPVKPRGSGKYATVIEFGVRVSPSEGFTGEIRFNKKYNRFEDWLGAPNNPYPPQGGYTSAYMNVVIGEYPDKTGYYKKFAVPNISPRKSYYWYFESDEPLTVLSAAFLDFSEHKP